MKDKHKELKCEDQLTDKFLTREKQAAKGITVHMTNVLNEATVKKQNAKW